MQSKLNPKQGKEGKEGRIKVEITYRREKQQKKNQENQKFIMQKDNAIEKPLVTLS